MRRKNIPRHVIGGVALTDGVLLHAPDAAVLALRRNDGTIMTKAWELPREKPVHPFFQLFMIRGIWLLVRTIVWNSRMRHFIDSLSKSEKPQDKTKIDFPQIHHLSTSLFPTVGIVAAFLLYAQVIMMIGVVRDWQTSDIVATQGDIITSLLVFLLFLYVIWHGGIWRYMGYHGAQHQAIGAYEGGMRTVKAVEDGWPFQPRCGAAVVSWVALLLVLVGYIWPQVGFWLSLSLALLFFGVAYEIVLLTDHYAATWWGAGLNLPGVSLQFLVARHPEKEQSEVAARALFELSHYSKALKKSVTRLDEPVLT